MSSQNIKSVLVEERSFPPSPEFTAKARLKPADVAALRREAAADHVGFWARQARSELRWHKPFTVTLDDSQAPNYRWFTDGELNVSYNCLDVHLEERGHKTAVTFVGEPGDVRHVSYRELHADVCRFANALLAQGVKAGRPRGHLHAADARSRRRHACLRAHRRHPLRGVRRLLGAVAARSHRRCRRRHAHHRRRRLARRQDRRAQGSRRQGAVPGLRHHPQRHRAQAHRPRRAHEERARPLVARRGRRPAAGVRAGLGRRRTSAVPAVHLRLHRQAQGHPARQRRLSTGREAHQQVGVRSQRRRRVLVHGRHRLGHRPQLRGLRSAGRGRHHRAVRRRADHSRIRDASGRSASRWASPFSTRRPPRSARS